MTTLLAHPTGNNFFREAAVGLNNADLLGELHISVAACGSNFWSAMSCVPGASELKRRSYPPELADKLRLHPWRELTRLLAAKLGIDSLVKHEMGWASVDACYQIFDRHVANRLDKSHPFDTVYSYEDGSLATFQKAQQQGLRRLYDLPIAYWKTSRRIHEEEAERLPAWRQTLTSVQDSPRKNERKDEELNLADAIICPSQFVADSLPEAIRSTKPVKIIPFGSPVIAPRPRTLMPNGKLRVLFAGSMSQRKGLADLMAAINLLDPAKFELHVMGAPLAPMEFYLRECPGFIRHTTRPHSQVLELMQRCDVFALPSLVEGRALVQQEALACGLPIIVTPNAGAEDLVQDEQAGFLVPIRSPEVIAERLTRLQANPDLLERMSKAAPIKAAEVTWQAYREAIVQTVHSP